MEEESKPHWNIAVKNPEMVSIIKDKKGRLILWERKIMQRNTVTTVETIGTLVKEGSGGIIIRVKPIASSRMHIYGSGKSAEVRHFYVSRGYRRSGNGDNLAIFTLRKDLVGGRTVKMADITAHSGKGAEKFLTTAGFVRMPDGRFTAKAEKIKIRRGRTRNR
ncbi:MAG: hypothetical protein V1911_04340 [Candidatus Micrarchaeota archaeon]